MKFKYCYAEYCLYCGKAVDGKIRSPYGNAMCENHYNKIYGDKNDTNHK